MPFIPKINSYSRSYQASVKPYAIADESTSVGDNDHRQKYIYTYNEKIDLYRQTSKDLNSDIV
jgi:hypothetical protein